MKVDKKLIGHKMGIGYVFNEEALFAEDMRELSTMSNTESLITCEESAFLRINVTTFKDMDDL